MFRRGLSLRIVVQINLLFPHFYEHLHGNIFKSTDEPLTDILQVVVAEYQTDLTVQTIQYLCPFICSTSLKGRLQKPMIFA